MNQGKTWRSKASVTFDKRTHDFSSKRISNRLVVSKNENSLLKMHDNTNRSLASFKNHAFSSIKDIIRYPYQDTFKSSKRVSKAKMSLLQSGIKKYCIPSRNTSSNAKDNTARPIAHNSYQDKSLLGWVK
jgi:hypothetical protein